MRHLRRLFRMTRLLCHLGKGLWWAWRYMPAQPPPRSEAQWRLVRRWHGRTLELAGIRLRCHGQRVDGPTLFVSNHVSWLDISVLLTVIDAGFVGKAELKDWPLLGFLVVRGGTIFIRRGARDAATNAAEEIGRRLARGDSAAVFPEGTTSRGGDAMRRFHPRLFEAARCTGARVQPIALVYDHPAAAFVDDEPFWRHLWRLLGEPRIHVDAYLLPAIETEGRDRRSIAAEAEAVVAGIVKAADGSRQMAEEHA